MKYSKEIQELIDKQGIRLDVGGGQAPMRGFLNLDNRPLKEVDIVWDLEKFPYPLPDNSCQIVMGSHIFEHIKPFGLSPQLIDLINLLVKKGVLTKSEVKEYIGEVKDTPIFLRVMDEMWRILRPGGQLMLSFPYAGSIGYWQDPSHINGINERTWEYFDPEGKHSGGILYHIYEPKPWKIEMSTYQVEGNMEIVLVKREEKKEYRKFVIPKDQKIKS